MDSALLPGGPLRRSVHRAKRRGRSTADGVRGVGTGVGVGPIMLAIGMSELLAGPATLVFTDIEGSTPLLKQLRSRYPEALSDHRRLLEHAFEEHGGREVDTQGDAFFFVFATARDAVLAAVRGTRALASHPWPEGTKLRVRMGIHTGGTSVADNRYHGVAVHRAARVCSAAHGGQILLTQTTHSLIADEEEELPGIELRDLGMHKLKGFDRPDRLYQVVAEALESAFPPLRTEAVDEGGQQEQLLTAAGVTAIAAEAEARALGHDYLATEHFLLAIVREEDTLGARVLKSLGVSDADVRPLVERIVVTPKPPGQPAPARLPPTPRTVTVLELALREALSFGVDVSGEHVLLGIARESSCVGAQILLEFGVDEPALRREITAALSPSAESPRPSRRRLPSLWRSGRAR
jgi:class 3 adenylate cyclase